MATATELNIDSTATAIQMAEEIFGDGVTVTSASYSGDALSSGIYSGADTTTPGVAPADSGVILSTGYVRDFTNSDGSTNTNQNTNTTTNTSGVNGDADFDSLAGASTFDASFLEIDFVPDGDTLTIDFVLSSEEYPEFANSQYNDVIGVWVNGVEAQVTIGDGTASIGNINDGTENVYVDNTGDQYNTEMDGFTITLTFVAPVNAGEINTLKIGVADTADSSYDTNLLIAGGSVQTAVVAQDDQEDIAINKTRVIDVLENDTTTSGTLTITHINDQAVTAGDTVTLATGQQITLNADGTLTVVTDGDLETVYFNYTADNGQGNSDTGLVEINQTVPCFLRGTLIRTPDGEVPVEDLRPGMEVLTYDNGPQVLQWTGSRRTACTAETAPVRFAKGSCGNTRDLYVSPQHRMVVSGPLAELLFGEEEVLVKAKDLVNDRTVRPAQDMQEAEYFHLLFGRHQILWANGALSESYQPGPESASGFDAGTQAEIRDLFPELCAETGRGYGNAARLSLRSFEARVLAAA
ncbi:MULTISPECIES: Hint domain-containing protein [unclassified Leisingera]|uniref:Hint domain-containing protein n=1 Tax=unclassified Leisingera TaxID=2614906 RepID=UPI0002E594E9|nr:MULTISPECIES: Hint domain-containing protein [unclassified Leisingera]KIC25311.1 2,3,4,5-tetrahydropyridine-2,6-carboxylate N-succinyltransferase [Leisingera sp. ANG-S3]KIC54637.1 2,3,4,5-tetrahydropyridine-2,6-carboxylate N-succinyltransferase [Leisingera sp. ANG-S]KID10597.1 2,3,4,5-tetrahydropyridine-2,6-carboxylate N-succinyltransferase [Leisingera sp. ANG1]